MHEPVPLSPIKPAPNLLSNVRQLGDRCIWRRPGGFVKSGNVSALNIRGENLPDLESQRERQGSAQRRSVRSSGAG